MKYKGGKNGSGVFQRLICMMPPHDFYIEMFLGSGAVLRRKKPARMSHAYELSKPAIAEIAQHLPADRFEPWDLNAEWDVVGPLPGCGGTSIGFNVPGGLQSNLEIYNVDAFAAVKAKYVASSYFWGLNDPTRTVLYADPPYPDSVRSSPGKIYEFELMAEKEHAELCDLLLSLPCKVIVSGYENELYNSKFKGWRKETINTTNRAGSRVIETVWLNFPEPVELHDYSHVGDNYRDRWRFEKRLRNWTGQLKAMRPAERGAMVEQLLQGIDAFNATGRAADVAAAGKLAKRAAKFEKKLKGSADRATPQPALAAVLPDLFEGEKEK